MVFVLYHILLVRRLPTMLAFLAKRLPHQTMQRAPIPIWIFWNEHQGKLIDQTNCMSVWVCQQSWYSWSRRDPLYSKTTPIYRNHTFERKSFTLFSTFFLFIRLIFMKRHCVLFTWFQLKSLLFTATHICTLYPTAQTAHVPTVKCESAER